MAAEQAAATVAELSFERSDIPALLEVAAGKTAGGDTVQRPYAVAASLWISAKNTKRVAEAEGAKFGSVADTIRGLLNLQSAMDNGLTIAPRWTVEALLNQSGFSDTFEAVM